MENSHTVKQLNLIHLKLVPSPVQQAREHELLDQLHLNIQRANRLPMLIH